MAPVPTQDLTWNKAEQTFTTEASDLGWRPGYYPDSVSLKSHRTGVVRTFTFARYERDRDGDVQAVVYYSRGLILRVFND